MSTSNTDSSEPEKKTELKDFEQALTRLEGIVRKLEAGDLPLEEAIALFEEGMHISTFCGRTLSEAERKVEILIRNAKGELVEQPFQPGPEDNEAK